MNTLNRKILLIGPGAILLVALALFVWGIRSIDKKSALIVEKNERANEAVVEKTLIESLSTLKATNKEEIGAFEDSTLTEEGLVEFIESLENKGQELGLKLEVASVNKSAGESLPPEVSILKISLIAEGSWEEVYAFLGAIESLPYRVTFEKLNLSKGDERWKLETSFSVHIFQNNYES